MALPPFPDRIHFAVSFPAIPEPGAEVWQTLCDFLSSQGWLPQKFEVSQIAGHVESFHSTTRLKLTPAEVGQLILDRKLTGFHVHTSYSKPGVSYHFRFDQKSVPQSTLGYQIDPGVRNPAEWSELIERIMNNWPAIGAWQWNHLYRVRQWIR
jgi:hypothetical protein